MVKINRNKRPVVFNNTILPYWQYIATISSNQVTCCAIISYN